MQRKLAALAAICCCLAAQTPEEPAFDVAVIKPLAPDDSRLNIFARPGGTFTALGAPAKLLVMQAFEVQESQITGDPPWMESIRWSLEAKVENEPRQLGPPEINPLLRSLLRDRFGLRYHRETQDRPALAMVAAKSGVKLQTAACPDGPGRGGLVGSIAFGSFRGTCVSLQRLAQILAGSLGRPIVNRTGFDGLYDYYFQFDAGSVQALGVPGARPKPGDFKPPDPNLPSLFDALEKELGLKLEATRAPVEMLVIDAIEPPSEN